MMETQTRGKGTIDHGLQGSVGTLVDVNPTRLSKQSQAVPLQMHILANFITKLPLAQEYDSILVVVDWLTKMAHFIPTTEKTSAKGLARLFKDNVWKLHGLSESIISDRGP